MNVTKFPNGSKSQFEVGDAVTLSTNDLCADRVVVFDEHRRKMMPDANITLVGKAKAHTIGCAKDYWLMLFFCGSGVLAAGYDEMYMLTPVAYTALLAACGILLAWIYQRIFLETFLLLHFGIAGSIALTFTLGIAQELSYVLLSVIVLTIILKLLDWL